ncbi:hypothetical protein ACROYT_G005269 [Oculina patagonica]
MRALTIRQKIISASKESDSGIKYDASSVQSLFLHALETGLADETIHAKIRPLTQDPKVADEDLIGAMSLAISAETERSNKFNPKGKSAKVFAVEGAAEANGKKEQQKDQILETLKAVQADLAAVQSEVKTLRETANNQKADTTRPSHAGNGTSVGASTRGCQGCRRKREACQSVRYCSVHCQKAHWPKHKVLCKAIKELSAKEACKEKGLGDTQDENVYASHLTPRQQERIAKLAGRKCSVQCYMNDKPVDVLWDTGAQVSIVSEDFLKSQLSVVQIMDIEQLLGADGSISLQAANGTDIPYCGWVEIVVRLTNENEAEITVPFLVTKENIEQPIIGFNVIELMVKNTGANDGDKLLGRMTESFRLSKGGDMQALISLIRTTNSDDFCVVKSTKKAHVLPAGQTVHLPCRANTGPIHSKTPVIFEPDELATWPIGLAYMNP